MQYLLRYATQLYIQCIYSQLLLYRDKYYLKKCVLHDKLKNRVTELRNTHVLPVFVAAIVLINYKHSYRTLNIGVSYMYTSILRSEKN